MAVRNLKPVTPGRRGMTSQSWQGITVRKPLKSLLRPLKKTGGRNNRGVITSRARGGGVKRHYRLVSFSLPEGFEGKVVAIEYDPNRSARLLRVQSQDGKHCYLLAPRRVSVGDQVVAGSAASISSGNRLSLRKMPIGSLIHNIALRPEGPGQIVRAAGTGAQLTAKEGDYAQVKLPSGEIRLFRLDVSASLGVVGNEQHKNVKLGKAGRKRLMGRRPRIRGVATNPVDHPHGGGDGKIKGYKTPVTPWGQPTLGYKTRHKRKSNRLIVRSRHLSKKKRKRKG